MPNDQVESIATLRQIPRPEWRLVRAVSLLERSLLVVDPTLRNEEGKVVPIGEIINERYREFFGDEIRNLNWALGIRNDVIHATGDAVSTAEIVRAGTHVINALEVFAMSLDDNLFGGLKSNLTGRHRRQGNRRSGQRGGRNRRRRKRHWSRRKAPAVIARGRGALIVPLILLAIVIALLVSLSPSDPSNWHIDIPLDGSDASGQSGVKQTLDEHVRTKKQYSKLLMISRNNPTVVADGGILRNAWLAVCERLGQSPELTQKSHNDKSVPLNLPDSLPGDFPPKLLMGPTSLFTQCHYRVLRGEHAVSENAPEVDRFRYFVYCIGHQDVMPRTEQQGIVYDWEGQLRPDRESGRIVLARLFRTLSRSGMHHLPAGDSTEQSEGWAKYNWALSRLPQHAFWYPSLVVELRNSELLRALNAADQVEAS